MQTLLDGSIVTLFIMIIVIAALAALMFIIRFQSRIIRGVGSKDAEVDKEILAAAKAVNEKTEEIVSPAKQADDQTEIVAAIIAAISAYTNLPESEFVIRGINRVGGNNSAWRNAGIFGR